MRRVVLTLLCVMAMSLTGLAHFVFVVPEAGGLTARILLSESLRPDSEVDVSLIARTMLWLRDTAGRETPLALTNADHAFAASIAPDVRGVIHGVADLGVMKSGPKPYVLVYYPKTIIGDAFDARTELGKIAPVEIVPLGSAGALRLQFVARGRPQPGAEMTVIMPDGTQKVVTTDAEGRTDTFAVKGHYGAWARFWEAAPGERAGEPYAEVRHYATLVFDTGSPQAGATGADRTGTRFATMPQAASSFGAVASDGWLYVYGGHVVPTHSYSTEAVSGRFNRLNLADGRTWEQMPGGPPLQGLNLAAYGGKIYRVGGMQPHNKPGDPQDVRSVADVARFDPTIGRWEDLPPLPSPRSSHDVVVVGNTLIVLGGWTLKDNDRVEWPESMHLLDLAATKLEWKSIPQPFKRRALIAASLAEKIYVMGGFNELSQVVHGVAIYDVRSGTWSNGPNLPGGAMSGFGPAATVADGRLYVSVDDGGLYCLSSANTWERVGRATPRIVHRLAPRGHQVLVIGGALKGANSDLIEAVSVGQ